MRLIPEVVRVTTFTIVTEKFKGCFNLFRVFDAVLWSEQTNRFQLHS